MLHNVLQFHWSHESQWTKLLTWTWHKAIPAMERPWFFLRRGTRWLRIQNFQDVREKRLKVRCLGWKTDHDFTSLRSLRHHFLGLVGACSLPCTSLSSHGTHPMILSRGNLVRRLRWEGQKGGWKWWVGEWGVSKHHIPSLLFDAQDTKLHDLLQCPSSDALLRWNNDWFGKGGCIWPFRKGFPQQIVIIPTKQPPKNFKQEAWPGYHVVADNKWWTHHCQS